MIREKFEDIDERRKALKEQMESLEIERMKLHGRWGICAYCGEEKQYIDPLRHWCHKCDEKQRQAESDEIYSRFIGKKIVKINAEPRYSRTGSPTIYSIELEGGYEITVEAYSDPPGMEIEKL